MIDKLKKSNRHKIISEWKSEEYPHEDGSRFFDLVIEKVRGKMMNTTSDPNFEKDELRIKLDILPMRLNLHQETLMFLLDFMNALDSPSKENDSTPHDLYFQSVVVSQLCAKIDYQPTSVIHSLSRIKNGKYFELLNLTSINGVEIVLDPMDVNGQMGVSNLVDAMTRQIMPQITGTKVFRILLGIMPIRSMYNVGSGVADLVVLPIQQYNRDGQVLRGLRRGIASFVSNVGVEAVSLSATGFQVSNYALESVGDMLSATTEESGVDTVVQGGSSESQQHSEPMSPASNLNAGIQKAYHEMERGLTNAKCAIIAIPREYDRAGSSGAALSVMRAMIITPSRALQGATGAVTQMLYGLLNEINPSSTENESLYKL